MEKPQETVTIYTIGYGNRSVDEFIEALQEHEIAYLIDVRSAPYSRYKPEFSREPLEAELQRQGVRYVFMGDTLGGHPDDEECYDVNGKVDYERVKKTERYQFGIKRLQTAVAQKQCVALMCSEGKPENCHRSKFIGETLEEQNIRVTHIDESDELQTQSNIIGRMTGGKMSLTNCTLHSEKHVESRRQIDPPRSQWDLLLSQLMPGERRVYELFDKKLPHGWEMYIQPHMNGLRPDLVLLNPNAGVAVYEIKDGNLNSIRHSIDSDRTNRNPLNKIKLYKTELLELYCPRLNDRFGHAARQAITAGLIFTKLSQKQVEDLLVPYRDPAMNRYPQYYPLVGSDSLDEENLEVLFPDCEKWGHQNPSRVMSDDTAQDLRGWLKEPAFSQEQRRPLWPEMNPRQREIATTRTQGGYRRVKGPAGSGKSVAIAARAAKLASEGQRVLVCTFNITLINYLRDLVARHARDLAIQQSMRSKVIRQQIEYFNFHYWCKRICISTGYVEDYNRLWREVFLTENHPDEEFLNYEIAEKEKVLDYDIPRLVSRIYENPDVREILPMYDAILVDEGQDYRPSWWQTLRKAVKSNGEMLLVADKTQDIYGNAKAWTEEAMKGAGFPGNWMELNACYRLPPKIVPFLRQFARGFLTGEEVDIPEPQPELDHSPVELRWVQVFNKRSVNVCVEEVHRQMERLRSDTAIPDITFLAGHQIGDAFVKEFERKHVHIVNTFGRNGGEARRQKLAFFQGDARVKATTLHSFKGWEARHLVVYVNRVASPTDCATLYTALTRLKEHPHGSMLTVVSSCPELCHFGRTWPDSVVVED